MQAAWQCNVLYLVGQKLWQELVVAQLYFLLHSEQWACGRNWARAYYCTHRVGLGLYSYSWYEPFIQTVDLWSELGPGLRLPRTSLTNNNPEPALSVNLHTGPTLVLAKWA